MAKCKITYYIPESNYQYTRITYKKGKAPESVNDGTIINVDYTLTECYVTGLDEYTEYWFTIFTDKSESESYQFTSGADEVDPDGIVIYKDGKVYRNDIIDFTNPQFVVSGLDTSGSGSCVFADDGIIIDLEKHSFPYAERTGGCTLSFKNTYNMIHTDSPKVMNADQMKRYINVITTSIKDTHAEIIATGPNNAFRITRAVGIGYDPLPSWYNADGQYPNYKVLYSSDTGTAIYDRPEELKLTAKFRDQQTDSSNGNHYLSYYKHGIGFTLDWNYYLTKMEYHGKITKIAVKLDKHLFTYDTDVFNIVSNYPESRYSEWTVKQIMDEVKRLGFNSFILRPYGNYCYTVFPITLSPRSDVRIKRDGYMDSTISNTFTCIGIEDFGQGMSTLPNYVSESANTRTLVRPDLPSYSSYYEDCELYELNGVKYTKPSQTWISSGALGMVFYTEIAYNHYYVNDRMVI